MAYTLSWYAANKVLYLSLKGNFSFEELNEINTRMMDVLENSSRKLSLILDVSELMAGYATVDSLRATQKYRDHVNLEAIIGIANNKLNRLITLVAFNLCRAYFIQFDTPDKVQTYMFQKGVAPASQTISPSHI